MGEIVGLTYKAGTNDGLRGVAGKLLVVAAHENRDAGEFASGETAVGIGEYGAVVGRGSECQVLVVHNVDDLLSGLGLHAGKLANISGRCAPKSGSELLEGLARGDFSEKVVSGNVDGARLQDSTTNDRIALVLSDCQSRNQPSHAPEIIQYTDRSRRPLLQHSRQRA